MGVIVNRLPEILGRHRIQPGDLAEVSGVQHEALQAFCQGASERADLAFLAAVLDGLMDLTGQEYTPADLLRYVPQTAEEETAEILQEHPEILERLRSSRPGGGKFSTLEEVAQRHGVELDE